MEILELDEARLAALGERMNEHGVDAASGELAALAESAAWYGVAPGAAAALVDPTSPGVVRERAFAVTALAVLRAARGERDEADEVVGAAGSHGVTAGLPGVAAGSPGVAAGSYGTTVAPYRVASGSPLVPV